MGYWVYNQFEIHEDRRHNRIIWKCHNNRIIWKCHKNHCHKNRIIWKCHKNHCHKNMLQPEFLRALFPRLNNPE